MAVRQQDIANRLHLSRSMVSGVLNDTPGVWASAETRARIINTAREMGYLPSAAARSLRSGKTRNVALVFRQPAQHAWFHQYGYVASELASFLRTHSHHLLIEPMVDQEEALAHLRDLARARSCDLVILWGTERDTEPQAQLLENLQMPFVVKGRFERNHPQWPQVDFDHEGMMRSVVDYFAAMGHQRIAYIGYNAEEPFRYRLLEGFQAAMQARTGQASPEAFVYEYGKVGADSREVATATEEWMKFPDAKRPTAIAVGADLDAWEGIEIGLARHGKIIGPEIASGQVAVAGTASSPLRLLFGEGRFLDTEFYGLVGLLCEEALTLLQERANDENAIRRYLPGLQMTPSRRLQTAGVHAVFPPPDSGSG